MDKAVTVDSCVDCGVTNIQALDCMELVINLIVNRVVNPYATSIGTLYQDDALHFKRFLGHMVATKSSIDDVDLTKLPKNMQRNTSASKNWCTTIKEKLYQSTSAYIISPLGYFIRASKAPVDYGDLYQKNTSLEQGKYIKRLRGGGLPSRQ